MTLETVRSGIRRMKRSVRLEDKVSLPGNPDAVCDQVSRENGWVFLVVRLVGLALIDLGQRLPARLKAGDLCGLGRLRDCLLGLRRIRQVGGERRQAERENAGS